MRRGVSGIGKFVKTPPKAVSVIDNISGTAYKGNIGTTEAIMLAGFPKQVAKEKISRGHYRLMREDGYVIEVRQGVGGWWFGRTGRKVKSLGVAEFDMRNGYTSKDQIEARQ